MRKNFMAFVAAVCACVSTGLTSCGQIAAPGDSEAANRISGAAQPNAEAVLRRMADYLAELPALACRVSSMVHIKGPELDNRRETKIELKVQRPNRLSLVVEEDMMKFVFVSDGKQLFQHVPQLKRYVVREAPEDLSLFTETGQAVTIPLLSTSGKLIPGDGKAYYDAITEEMSGLEFVGTEKVGEVLCDHVRLKREKVAYDIWIEAGERPLVHKVVPDISKQLADESAGLAGAKLTWTVSYTDWDVAPQFTDADFSFTPPADAELVESLFEAEEPAPHPLVGQPAPAFETVDLEGRPIDLKQHLGKRMVLLDFWATWCGPCVEAMPDVDAVAEKYADQGLVFYAVNAGEDAATAKEFLTQSKIDVPVAMDPDGTISKLYQVDGIPQTVLIGKDGKVQVIHVGFSSELGKILTQNIEDLLAGKDLASETLREAEKAQEKPDAEHGESGDAAEPAGENASTDDGTRPNGDATQVDESVEAEKSVE